jgi:hypothetical protein
MRIYPLFLITILLLTALYGANILLDKKNSVIRDLEYKENKQKTHTNITNKEATILDQYKNLLLIQTNNKTLQEIIATKRYEQVSKKELLLGYLQLLILLTTTMILITILLEGRRTHKHLHKKITYHKQEYHDKKNETTKTQTKRERQKKIPTNKERNTQTNTRSNTTLYRNTRAGTNSI